MASRDFYFCAERIDRLDVQAPHPAAHRRLTLRYTYTLNARLVDLLERGSWGVVVMSVHGALGRRRVRRQADEGYASDDEEMAAPDAPDLPGVRALLSLPKLVEFGEAETFTDLPDVDQTVMTALTLPTGGHGVLPLHELVSSSVATVGRVAVGAGRTLDRGPMHLQLDCYINAEGSQNPDIQSYPRHLHVKLRFVN